MNANPGRMQLSRGRSSACGSMERRAEWGCFLCTRGLHQAGLRSPAPTFQRFAGGGGGGQQSPLPYYKLTRTLLTMGTHCFHSVSLQIYDSLRELYVLNPLTFDWRFTVEAKHFHQTFSYFSWRSFKSFNVISNENFYKCLNLLTSYKKYKSLKYLRVISNWFQVIYACKNVRLKKPNPFLGCNNRNTDILFT